MADIISELSTDMLRLLAGLSGYHYPGANPVYDAVCAEIDRRVALGEERANCNTCRMGRICVVHDSHLFGGSANG